MDPILTGAFIYETGLTVLAQPEQPEVDIVFIHGLQGHPRKTWTRKAVTRQSAESTHFEKSNKLEVQPKPRRWSFKSRPQVEAREVFWPADLLPYDCPTARIMTWGYDSRVSRFFGGASNQNSIYTHARDLLYSLSRERDSCLGRPLIFIAHSLGGIIVKDVVWRSSVEKSQDLADIYKSTRGILFLGTPHRGSDWAQTAKTLERIVTAAGFDTNTKNIKGLLSNSDELSRCQENFMRLYEQIDRSFSIRTFLEAKGMAGTGLLRLSSKVVDDDSSMLSGSSQERPQSINDNHMDMCRFSDREDVGYRKVMKEIQALITARMPQASSFNIAPSPFNASNFRLETDRTAPLEAIPAQPVPSNILARSQPPSSFLDSSEAPLLRSRNDESGSGGVTSMEYERVRGCNAYPNSQQRSQRSTWEEFDSSVRNLRVPPRLSTEHVSQVSGFINENLGNFYGQNNSSTSTPVEEMVERVVVRAQLLTEDFGLSSEYIPRLASLALYDFVILCDDSFSMTQESIRIPALKETVKNIAELATKLEPSGISIRFLNYDGDKNFDNLRSVDDIEHKINMVSYKGDTRLGQQLQAKVVNRIITKASNKTLLKPVIVAIITDGEPTTESRGSLSNTIFRTKMNSDLKSLGEGVVVFLLCRVGNSDEAKRFLGDIEKEERLKGAVHVSHESVDEKLAVFQRAKGDRIYFAGLIDLFYTALDSVYAGKS